VVVGGDGVADAGVEPVALRQNRRQGVAVDGDVEFVDGVPQLLEHAR
jgi:hypothetical protein